MFNPLKEVSPDIYRINGFRILNLPLYATRKKINKEFKKIESMMDLGNQNVEIDRILPLSPKPDLKIYRKARNRLSDPKSRFIDEVFWFWPQNPASSDSDDEAIKMMEDGDYDGAVSIWKKREMEHTQSMTSAHNLAVFYHALALDFEKANFKSPLIEKKRKKMDSYWKKGYLMWKVTLSDNKFKNYVKERVRELNDPLLKETDVERVFSDLPLTLLSINVKLATNAMRKNNENEFSKQVNIIKNSTFDKRIINNSLEQLADPLSSEIIEKCKNVDSEVDKEPEKAIKIIKDFLADTQIQLKWLDKILPDSSKTINAHDKVADLVRTSINKMLNHYRDNNDPDLSEKIKIALPLIKRALTIAKSESTRSTIKQDISIHEENIEFYKLHGKCWFCGKNAPEESANVKVPMHKVTGTETVYMSGGLGTRTHYREIELNVPRCKECKDIHKSSSNMGILGAVGGFFAGIALTAFIPVFLLSIIILPILFYYAGRDKFNLASIGSIIGFFLAYILLYIYNSGIFFIAIFILPPIFYYVGGKLSDGKDDKKEGKIKPESHKDKFPRVKENLADGYVMGPSPGTKT